MTTSERIYRLLLRLYPQPFRFEYGELMIQLFLDQLRDAREGRARRGVLATWLSTFADLGASSVDEHLHGDRSVGQSIGEPPSLMARGLGLVGIAGGLVLLAAWVINIPQAINALRLILFNLGAIAVAIAAWLRLRDGHRSWITFPVAFVVAANGAYAIGTVATIGAAHPFAGLGGAIYAAIGSAMWVADASFGRVAARFGRIGRVAGVALAVGGLGALGSDRFWEPNQLLINLSLVGVALNGVGWILLGTVLLRRRISTLVATPS